MPRAGVVVVALAACGAPPPPELLAPAPMPPTQPAIDAAVAPADALAARAIDLFWLRGDAACPAESKIEGSAPPNGSEVYCVLRTAEVVHGPYAKFDDAGQLRELRTYDHGALDGIATSFHANGQRFTEGAYKHGIPDGTHTEWDASGRAIDAFTIANGTGTELAWFEDTGKKQTSTPYANGVREGEWTEWDRQGRVHQTGIYRAGARDGVWLTSDNGQPVRADIYRADKRVQVLDYQDGAPLGTPGAPGACADAQGARDAYRAQSKQPLSDGYSCVAEPLHFGGVTLVAKLVADRGCEPVGTLIDCVLQPRRDAKTILARAGWARARPAARAAIAQAYADEIELMWASASGIAARPEADGSVVVTAGPNVTLRFAANGTLTRR